MLQILRRILVDANLLVLLIVGLTDEKLISTHKRTLAFLPEDFLLLTLFLEKYEQVVVTPHVLTETYNLAAQVGEPHRSRVLRTLQTLIGNVEELHHSSKEAALAPSFVRLGLTDSAILNVLDDGLPLVTVDFDLYYQAAEAGHEVINFNHLRAEHLWSS
jgi:predicted nucleic acid-binding protein